MQKKLIALAVAAAAAAPAFAQSNVTIYGAMRVSVDHLNYRAANSDKWQVEDRASRIGFKGSEDLGGGLKAIWQWESMLNSTGVTATNTAAGSQRNTFLGLTGGFGTVLFGTHDTPYKLGGSAELFGDTAVESYGANANFGIIGRNGFKNRPSNVSAYISPTWSGFHFAIAGVAGETAATKADGLADALSMVAVYANGPLKVTLGHEKFSKEQQATTNDKKATKLNAAYKIGAIGLGYTYESSHDSGAATQVKDKGHLASVSYAMGATTLGLQYGKFDNKNAGATGDDIAVITVGAYHNLSKRTQAYAAYGSSNDKSATNADLKTITFGLNHSF